MKDYNDIKVLLIEGRARQVLPMAKSLRALGCEVTTYNGSKLDPGYASKYPHRKRTAMRTILMVRTGLSARNWRLIIMTW